ncbi:BT4734/BF3469 family protein [Bacteroides sp.]
MFGISNSVKSREVRECTPDLFRRVVRSERVARICAEIEDALEKVRRGEMSKEDFEVSKAELKKQLPIFTPHATFRNGRRLNAEAIPSGLSMYDIDHIDNPRGLFEERIAAHVTEWGVVLAHVTPSTEGLRLFFVMPEGASLAEAQKWMSGQLGDKEYDQSVKDYARSSFAVPENYILYMDEEGLFKKREIATTSPSGYSSPEEENQVTTTKCTPKAAEALKKIGEATKTADEDLKVTDILNADSGQTNSGLNFKGIPYADIISEWFRLSGGEPVQGERNDKLHRLASHLRYIADNDEVLMLSTMPRYGLSEEEMRGLIHSACTAKFYSMPKVMQEAVRRALQAMSYKLQAMSGAASLPPVLPKRLPALVKLLLSRTPDLYRPAVAHAVFPALAAHLWRVRFRYIDNVEHEATLMNVLMAGTGAGKDCISEPINRIMADVRRRDEDNLQREREWKNEVNSKGANKDKRARPEGLVIQEIDADMTNPAFVMRTAEADGHFLYTKLNEIDQFDALRGSGHGGQQFQIMCLAFDPGNRYGQTRVGAMSVTEKVTIRFNWNAATTIQKGKRYFSHVLTDGPISRINFCTIPEREIGAEMPVYGSYDANFNEELRPYIENLTRATGLVDCPQAYKLAVKLKEENAEFARLSQSRVYENLSFRANVIAYLKACVLYVANGYRWDKTMEEFVRWSLQYDLWCKMEFFGSAIEEAQTMGAETGRRTPGRRSLLELLPEEFTLADAVCVRQAEGMNAEGTGAMLRQWVHRRYVTIVTNDKYKRIKK